MSAIDQIEKLINQYVNGDVKSLDGEKLNKLTNDFHKQQENDAKQIRAALNQSNKEIKSMIEYL